MTSMGMVIAPLIAADENPRRINNGDYKKASHAPREGLRATFGNFAMFAAITSR